MDLGLSTSPELFLLDLKYLSRKYFMSEMLLHPEKYKRYSSFKSALDEK